MSDIHPSAIVDPKAEIAESAIIGPYATIGPHVRIGANTRIGAHTVIEGHTDIGADNHIYQFASVGAAPQDKKYKGEPTRLRIGQGNTIREFCTINTGTAQDLGTTSIGDDNWIMAYVHIAHDCTLANHTIIANAVQLAGHVHIANWAIVGGLSGIHQFVRIGEHAMVGFSSRINQDVPPFVTCAGNPVEPTGINQEGLKRRGFDAERIAHIKQIYRLLYRKNLALHDAIDAIANLPSASPQQQADTAVMVQYLSQAKRGIVR